MEMKKYSGISVCNPVDMDEKYLKHTLDYAIKLGFKHYQLIGPIHNPIKGNIDGMIKLRKYSEFNTEKDLEYVDYNLKVVNEVTKTAKENGIFTYMWHHELDLPYAFGVKYKEVLNSYGDIEVSHPLVKDFLENKIIDFFYEYPYIDGIILTLHETKVPLLKLKDQKLGKTERVKYVTKILYDTCTKLGKELIVRPFASVEEDYEMMAKAYNEISKELVIMDKWTQFDWSLTLPNNAFFNKITENPLLVETDIFGEYFGLGWLPLMLKDHIESKFAYSEKFSPVGYVSRIDRSGEDSFGTVNEVNLVIMASVLQGKNTTEEINKFFTSKYGKYGKDVYEIMLETEEVQRKIFYADNYYFHQQSYFPQLNHSKNHFYFEMLRKEPKLDSGEWFIPLDYKSASREFLLKEKEQAVETSKKLLEKVEKLEGLIDKNEYADLHEKFLNLYLTSQIWQELLKVFLYYIQAIEEGGKESDLFNSIEKLIALDKQGKDLLSTNFYAIKGVNGYAQMNVSKEGTASSSVADRIVSFVEEIVKSYYFEKVAKQEMDAKNYYDYILCGSAIEGHSVQKEVNFSDTMLSPFGICRVAGTLRGSDFSRINTHGWFGYTIKVRKNAKNTISVVMGALSGTTDIVVHIQNKEYVIKNEKGKKEYTFTYNATNEDSIYIRFDRLTNNTPCVYSVAVK